MMSTLAGVCLRACVYVFVCGGAANPFFNTSLIADLTSRVCLVSEKSIIYVTLYQRIKCN